MPTLGRGSRIATQFLSEQGHPASHTGLMGLKSRGMVCVTQDEKTFRAFAAGLLSTPIIASLASGTGRLRIDNRTIVISLADRLLPHRHS